VGQFKPESLAHFHRNPQLASWTGDGDEAVRRFIEEAER
jgi:hypothetical protein